MDIYFSLLRGIIRSIGLNFNYALAQSGQNKLRLIVELKINIFALLAERKNGADSI